MEECNICYEKKNVKDILCCKGKKWCSECEKKSLNKYSKCPFCRRIIKSTVHDQYEVVCLHDGYYVERLTPDVQYEELLLYPDSHMRG